MKTVNYTHLTILLAVVLFLNQGCHNYEDLQSDPNRAVNAPPTQIFTGIQQELYKSIGQPWEEVHRLNQFYAITFDYYGNQDYNWGTSDLDYDILRNVKQMESEAKRLGDNGLYSGLAKFFKAYFFVNMTQRVGDIPITDALQGKQNFYPKYDSQKEVYKQVFRLLEDANNEISPFSGETIQGDIFLDGNILKWQKFINSFRLRVLISLSIKEGDSDLNIKQQFADIIGNPQKYPIISELNESAKITYYNLPGNLYPINPGNRGFYVGRYVLSSTYVNPLIKNKDPRLFVVADPAPEFKNSGDPDYATKFTSYKGANSGDNLGDLYVNSNLGKYALPKDNRYFSYTGEPTFILGFSEVNFTIAEAINRGWISGNAEAYYNAGIKASMEFYGISEDEINTFLNNALVDYAGNNMEGLKQILTQKYIAFFQNSGWEAYYNQRRTGVPEFSTGPGNHNGGKIPKRWIYPQSEYQNNNSNLKEALQRQFGGGDDINASLWLITP